jgi:hypothetical protein
VNHASFFYLRRAACRAKIYPSGRASTFLLKG